LRTFLPGQEHYEGHDRSEEEEEDSVRDVYSKVLAEEETGE